MSPLRMTLVAGICLLAIPGRLGAQNGDGASKDPLGTVQRYLVAVAAHDAVRMNALRVPSAENDPAKTGDICAWELAGGSRWSHTILGVHADTVSVLLKESSDFYRLLGVESRSEVSEFVVRDGLIQSEIGRYTMLARGSDTEAMNRFRQWMTDKRGGYDTTALDPRGRIRFRGESGRRLMQLLRAWRREGA